MADLNGQTIATTYSSLLKFDDNGTVETDNVQVISDGRGTNTSLSLSTLRASIVLGSTPGDDFKVDGTTFVVEGDTNNVGIGTVDPDTKLVVSNAGNGEFEFAPAAVTNTLTHYNRTTGANINASEVFIRKYLKPGGTQAGVWRSGGLTLSPYSTVATNGGVGSLFISNANDNCQFLFQGMTDPVLTFSWVLDPSSEFSRVAVHMDVAGIDTTVGGNCKHMNMGIACWGDNYRGKSDGTYNLLNLSNGAQMAATAAPGNTTGGIMYIESSGADMAQYNDTDEPQMDLTANLVISSSQTLATVTINFVDWATATGRIIINTNENLTSLTFA